MTRWLLIGLCALLTACSADLYHNQDEQAVNEMIVALEQAGVAAEKKADPDNKGTWILAVPTGARVQAIHELQIRGLPKPKPEGFSTFYPSEGLIPTAGEEHVLRTYALSQEIRRGLLTVDYVVDAHVSLVVPNTNKIRLSSTAVTPPTASVVVKHLASVKSPISTEQIKGMVSGSVQNLKPENVTVLITPAASAAQPLKDPGMVQVGPFSVAAANKSVMQFVFIGMIAMIILLALVIGFLVVRKRS